MCHASGLTRFTQSAKEDTSPQPLSWEPRAYQNALRLYDDVQLHLRETRAQPLLLLPTPPHDGVQDHLNGNTTTSTTHREAADRHLHPSMLEEAISAIQGALRWVRSMSCSSPEILRSNSLYGPEGTYMSFNGGKDATVVINIYVAVLADYYRENKIEGESLC